MQAAARRRSATLSSSTMRQCRATAQATRLASATTAFSSHHKPPLYISQHPQHDWFTGRAAKLMVHVLIHYEPLSRNPSLHDEEEVNAYC